jgi:hypothetical protein
MSDFILPSPDEQGDYTRKAQYLKNPTIDIGKT